MIVQLKPCFDDFVNQDRSEKGMLKQLVQAAKKQSAKKIIDNTICFSSDCPSFRSCLLSKQTGRAFGENTVISWVDFYEVYKGKCDFHEIPLGEG